MKATVMSATSDTSRIPLGSRFEAAPGRAAQIEIRIGLAITAAAVVIAVLAAVFYLTLALQWRGDAFLGALLTRTLTVDGSQPLAGEVWGGLNAGLQRGDHIIGVNGEIFPADPDEAEAAFDAGMQTFQPGEQIRLTFERLTPNGRMTFNNTEG